MSLPIQLSTGVHVLLRPPRAIQFGLDSRHAGIIELPVDSLASTDRIIRSINQWNQPLARNAALKDLVEAGLGAEYAHSLLEDLLHTRVLCEVQQLQVSVLGDSELAGITKDMLRASGYNVRSPISRERESDYIAATDPLLPLILIDRMTRAQQLAGPLVRHISTFFSASIVDAFGTIGPLHINGTGPCPLCMALYHAHYDPTWNAVMLQQSISPAPAPAALLASTAAGITAVVDALFQRAQPPGGQLVNVQPGLLFQVTPLNPPHSVTVNNNPRCPECFSGID